MTVKCKNLKCKQPTDHPDSAGLCPKCSKLWTGELARLDKERQEAGLEPFTEDVYPTKAKTLS